MEYLAHKLHDKFLNKKISATEITSFFLNRIEKLDANIGAFLSIFKEQALKKAQELDDKIKRKEKVGKLAGIPVAIKDNILVKGTKTTCASKFLANFKAPFQAKVTELIEKEDGIIIGKTNLDEFAMGASCEHSALKTTKNPWNLDYVPGGSSGGSAAACASRMAPLALGSDTGGSIRQPAAFCGIVGMKPTYGRVSRYGLVAFGSSLDQIGPMATCVKDAALLLEVIGKHCPYDSTSFDTVSPNYTEILEQEKTFTIGVPWKFLDNLAKEPKELFTKALKILEQHSFRIVEIDLDILRYAIPAYYILAPAEASTNLARFDGIRYGIRSKKAKTLDEVYNLSKEEGFGKEVKRRILLGTFVLSSGYHDAYYTKAQKVRKMILQSYNTLFQSCDLIALPTTPNFPFKLKTIQDPVQMYLEDMYTVSANLAGLPAISIPIGYGKTQLPFGMQFMASQKEETKVLQAAYFLEQQLNIFGKMPPLHL